MLFLNWFLSFLLNDCLLLFVFFFHRVSELLRFPYLSRLWTYFMYKNLSKVSVPYSGFYIDFDQLMCRKCKIWKREIYFILLFQLCLVFFGDEFYKALVTLYLIDCSIQYPLAFLSFSRCSKVSIGNFCLLLDQKWFLDHAFKHSL